MICRTYRAVQERAQAILDAAEAECRSIMNLFAVQLVKLPKQVTSPHRPSRGPLPEQSLDVLIDTLVEFLAMYMFRQLLQVRDMPLGQFRSCYGSDINAVLLEDINKRIAASQVSSTHLPQPSMEMLVHQETLFVSCLCKG